MASNSLSDLAHTIFSYNTNIMLAALISLLLVVLVVLVLHAYANCCFFPRPRPLTTVSYVLAPPRIDPLPFDSASAPSKALHPSLVSAIPLFVYESENDNNNNNKSAMCVICLCEFEDRDIGRRLTQCGHAFHLHCIDMWLDSHANCPVCRAPVVADAAAECEGGVGREMEDRNNCDIHRHHNQQHSGDQFHSSHSASSSSSSSSSSTDPPLMSLVVSLKRIMSRNRTEGRIFPSSNAHELDV